MNVTFNTDFTHRHNLALSLATPRITKISELHETELGTPFNCDMRGVK
jgi:hypothetical protein